jgi:hypothetical protein
MDVREGDLRVALTISALVDLLLSIQYLLRG